MLYWNADSSVTYNIYYCDQVGPASAGVTGPPLGPFLFLSSSGSGNAAYLNQSQHKYFLLCATKIMPTTGAGTYWETSQGILVGPNANGQLAVLNP
jgi:hypothetical protein